MLLFLRSKDQVPEAKERLTNLGVNFQVSSGEIPVVEDMVSRKLAGVITDRDIATRIVAAGKNSADAKACDCMTTPCVSVTPDTSLKNCCEVMETNKIRRVPVVDERGGVVGIVSLADVVRSASASTAAAVVKEVSTDV